MVGMHGLGNRMFDLQARVELEEEIFACLIVNYELAGTYHSDRAGLQSGLNISKRVRVRRE